MKTNSALKRPIPRMYSQMNIEISSLSKKFAANVTLKVFYISMSSNDMLLYIFFACQYFLTYWTLPFLLKTMITKLLFFLLLFFFIIYFKLFEQDVRERGLKLFLILKTKTRSWFLFKYFYMRILKTSGVLIFILRTFC